MTINQQALTRIKNLPAGQQAQFLPLLKQLELAEQRELARTDFLAFVHLMWPIFIQGRHHKIMARAFERIAEGSLKRLIINMPPRHTKSEFASWLLPAWYLGQYPDQKVIQTSHTAELATGFGRKVRNLVGSEEYRGIFQHTDLMADSKAAGRWQTSRGGEYFALGVGGAVAGKGANLFIIDDPHSEKEGFSLDIAAFDRAYEWYTSGPRQRLQPDAAIVMVMTRWGVRDLTGRIVKAMTKREGVDNWEIIEFPAILPSGKPLWPGYWPLRLLDPLRDELPTSKWEAQYQQNPTSEEGALVKREWWKLWERDEPPSCEFVIQSWDTAYKKTERSDFSACTTWGVFFLPDDNGEQRPNIILLDAFKERLEFPDLKKRALEMYNDRKPDAFIVEAKASGLPLIYELRAMGIPVAEFTPTRGNDKVVRVNSVSDLFASGIVWAPDTRWANEVIEEFAAFPQGEHDDLVDSGTQALMRFRQGGFIKLESDEEMEPMVRNRVEYY